MLLRDLLFFSSLCRGMLAPLDRFYSQMLRQPARAPALMPLIRKQSCCPLESSSEARGTVQTSFLLHCSAHNSRSCANIDVSMAITHARAQGTGPDADIEVLSSLQRAAAAMYA